MMHHAYVYEGSLALLPALADSARAAFDFTGEHNPSVSVRSWEQFGIDEARELAREASLRAVGDRALFVLGVTSITSEAQQALLKLFEEPQPGVLFVLLIPQGTLLPTVRSRFLPYPEQLAAVTRQVDVQAAQFVRDSYTARSAFVTAFVKDEERLRERARDFFDALERVVHKAVSTASSAAKHDLYSALSDIAHFRHYLSDKAPSLKMLLEHFAATIPQEK